MLTANAFTEDVNEIEIETLGYGHSYANKEGGPLSSLVAEQWEVIKVNEGCSVFIIGGLKSCLITYCVIRAASLSIQKFEHWKVGEAVW